MATYVKLTGSPFASDTYVGEGSLANLTDSNKTTLWHNGNANEGTINSFCGISFVEKQRLAKLEIDFSRWGSKIAIGYANALPVSVAGLTIVRTIDVNLVANDDLGVAWGSDRVGKRTNTILLDSSISASYWAIINLSNSNSVLSDSTTGNNSRLTVYELSAYKDADYVVPPPPTSDGPLPFTAQANTSYTENGGTPAHATDGQFATTWVAGTVNAANPTAVFALVFSEPVNLRRIEAQIASWGRYIQVGYADAYSANKADYTILTEIDTAALDSAGRSWTVSNANIFNTIALPSNDVIAKVWMLSTKAFNGSYTGTLGSAANNTYVDRCRIREIRAFNKLQIKGGVNPKVPPIIPTTPYDSTPSYWTRTEFSTVGQHTFTPKSDTSLLLVVAVGGGAAGFIETDQSGNTSPLSPSLLGGNTKVSSSAGLLFEAGGGGRNAGSLSHQYGDIISDITDNAPSDWVKWQDAIGLNAGPPSATASAQAGAASKVNSVAGASFSLPAGNMNAGLPSSVLFTGTAPLVGIGVASTDYFVRDSTYGYRSTGAGTGYGTATITFTPIKLVAGQKLVFNYTKTHNGWTHAFMNGVVFGQSYGTSGGTFTFTCTETGYYTLKFDQGASNSGGHFTAITSIAVTGYGYGRNAGGGSGRTVLAYLKPVPLTLDIGVGGTPMTSGYTVPANAAGTRGAGGAAGGAGGDGVVVIYEFYGLLPYDDNPPPPLFDNYNIAAGSAVAGTYRTDYLGANLASGYQNATVYSHTLRPSTKTVLFVMVGAGATIGNGGSVAARYAPTKVTIGDKQFIAGSGISPGDGFSGGTGGTFSSIPDGISIVSSNGSAGSSSSSGTALPDQAVIVGRYGGAASNSPGSVGGGGTGSYAFAATQDLPEDGIIQIEVANTSNVAGYYYNNMGGAVFVFESESDFGPLITQLSSQTLIKNATFSQTQTTQVSEQVLVKEKQTATQTSQVSEQTFIKAPQTETWTSQVSEQVLIKEDENSNPLQVSYADVAYVVDATDPETAVTNLSQQTLVKDKIQPTNVTNAVQQILLKSFPAIFRVSQISQQLLVAETPSVFFMNFGNLENPLKHVLYDSRTVRATSVPDGAVVQLEGNFAPGSYMVINGEDVGLSSPISNNAQVSLHSGVTNYYQKSINVYAYYLTNGETTRELVGIWNVTQPDLKPVVTRAYSALWTAKSFLFLPTRFGLAQLHSSLFAGARSMLVALVEILMGSGNSKVVQLEILFAKANTSIATSLQSVITKALASTADAAKSMFTKARAHLSNPFAWEYTQAKVDDYVADDFVSTPVGYGSVVSEKTYEKPSDGIAFVIPEYLETHAGYGAYENKSFIDLSVNDSAFEITDSVHTRAYSANNATSYSYNDVGKSTESGITWTAILGSDFARQFGMSTMGTIAYSVLGGVSYDKGVGVSLDSWLMPTDTAEVTKAVYGMFGTAALANPKAKFSMFQQEAIARKSENFDTFPTAPIWFQRNSSPFKVATEKTQHHSGIFNTTPIYTTNNHKLAALYPYLKSELVVKGTAPALTYMGFNTRQDALDFTENFYGVSVLNAYNGFIYNLDVDRSFICEISYVGPISGLMQGG